MCPKNNSSAALPASSEQYERAKNILKEYAEGHNKLADILISREVIFTEDVEQIFGKRQWTSRTDEILAAKSAQAAKAEAEEETENAKIADERAKDLEEANNSNDKDSEYPANMPPLPEKK